jgi:peptide/nickel transport system substrate-binding protein
METSKQANFTIGCSYPDYIMELNTARKPFDNVDVRRAVFMAIDRKTIGKTFLPDSPLLSQVFPKGFPGHDPALDKDIPYNVAKAKSLIDKAGATGASVTAIFPATDPYPDLATVIQQQLGAVGIKLTVQPITPALTIGEWRKGSYDSYIGAFSGSPDPAMQLANYIEVENFGGTAALPAGLPDKAAKAKDLPIGSKQRDEAYQEISRMLVDSPVHVPLFQFCTGFASSPKVVNMDKVMAAGNISWSDLSYAGIAAGRS